MKYEPVKREIQLPCGSIGVLDMDGCYGYICKDCFTVYGSISNSCSKKFETWEILKEKCLTR